MNTTKVTASRTSTPAIKRRMMYPVTGRTSRPLGRPNPPRRPYFSHAPKLLPFRRSMTPARPPSPTSLGVKRVADRIAHEVQRDDQNENADDRRPQKQWVVLVVTHSVVDRLPPRRRTHDADAEVREAGLGGHELGNHQREVDDDRRDEVRQ